MTPDRATRMYEVFRAVLECDPSGRAARLEELCGGDVELRTEVERLLADDERAGRDDFLNPPAAPIRETDGGRRSPFPLRGLEVHIRCPHCRNPIELVGLTAEEVVCPSCGSTFRLERESTAPWSPRGGQRRLGRFELIETVGMGGFGTVYKARDPQLDRTVAIKVPRAGNLTSDEDRDRFLREGRSVAQLRHPGIVPVHEVGEHEEVPYLVSDFVRGLTLSDLLTGRRPGPREAARLVAEVAEALQYAHDRGVVHRDVKPSNILLDDAGRPHLMDFGLARRDAGEITVTLDGQVLGTPAYMSPEQAKGEAHRVDGRSDVYSLGVILYELLTGELPFRGNTRMLLHQVLHDDPKPPRGFSDKIPRDLETVCMKAMAKEPHRRYTMAAEFAADLCHWLAGEPITARPVGSFERAWCWTRRHPAAAGLIAASAVALVALIAAGFFVVYNGQLQASYARLESANQAEAAARKTADEQRGFAVKAQAETQKALELANTYTYFHRIALADAAWRDGDVVRMRLLLDECRPEQRRWEWHYLDGLRHAALLDLKGKEGAAYVAFSRDGAILASVHWGGPDSAVIIRDAITGRERLTLRGIPGGFFPNVAFSPDLSHIAFSDRDGIAKVWDMATGRESLSLKRLAPTLGRGLAFSPDGNRIATIGEDGAVRVWDAMTGQGFLTLPKARGFSGGVMFSPDGRRLAIWRNDRTVLVCDAMTGQRLRTLLVRSDAILRLAFSPDGTRIAGAEQQGIVQVWDTTSGQERFVLKGHVGLVQDVAFSADGTRLATAGVDRVVKVWDVATGQEQLSLKGHTGDIWAIALSPDGIRLASSGSDGVRVWDATQRPEVRRIVDSGLNVLTSNQAAFSADGNRLAFGDSSRTVKVLDLSTGQVIRALSLTTGHETRTSSSSLDLLYALALSPDGRLIVTSRVSSGVQVRDLATGRTILTLRRLTGAGIGVVFSPNGARIATTSSDRTVKVWDAATGKEHYSLNLVSNFVAFSPDSQSLAAAVGGTVRIWDAATGQEVVTLKGHSGTIYSAAFSPDGGRIATASSDRTAKLWNAATGQEVVTLKGHSGTIYSVAFSPDGERIATASEDQAVRLWDTTTGQEVLTFKGHTGPVTAVAFHRDGSWIASTGWDSSVMVWEVLGSAALTPPERRSRMEKRWAVWQRQQAENCERQKQWFAAVWHLDRLLARNPDDANLRARRAAAQAQLDEEEKQRQSQAPAPELPVDVFAK